jgi:hypothetical protein
LLSARPSADFPVSRLLQNARFQPGVFVFWVPRKKSASRADICAEKLAQRHVFASLCLMQKIAP